jgi:hypothetical protein
MCMASGSRGLPKDSAQKLMGGIMSIKQHQAHLPLYRQAASSPMHSLWSGLAVNGARHLVQAVVCEPPGLAWFLGQRVQLVFFM